MKKEYLRGRERELYELAVGGGVLEAAHNSRDAELFRLFRRQEKRRQIEEAKRDAHGSQTQVHDVLLLTDQRRFSVTSPRPSYARESNPHDLITPAQRMRKPDELETAEMLFHRRLQQNIIAMGSEIGKVSDAGTRRRLIETLERRAEIEFNVLVAQRLGKELPGESHPLAFTEKLLTYAVEHGMPFIRGLREEYVAAIRKTCRDFERTEQASHAEEPTRGKTPKRRRSGVRLFVETLAASILLAACPPEPNLQRASKAAYEAVEGARYVIRLGEVAMDSWKWKEAVAPSLRVGRQELDISVFKSPFAIASTARARNARPMRNAARSADLSRVGMEPEPQGDAVPVGERAGLGDVHSAYTESIGLRRYRELMEADGITLNF